MIFVDTGAWFAIFVPNDADHRVASVWLRDNVNQLITTDYIVDELLTLMKVRGEFDRAVKAGELLLNNSIALLEWITPVDVQAARIAFRRFRDKGWSFTDCTSRAVIAWMWPFASSLSVGC